MRPAPILALVVVASASCGGSPQKYAAAALTAGVAVAAAAINRAATGECWATCPEGSRCDHDSGTCVALPCRNACPADFHCVTVNGQETCVSGGWDTASQSDIPALEEKASEPRPAPEGEPDPCRGLCFASEQCVQKGSVADCVPRKDIKAPQ
jgi:hypothetical protein